MWKTYGWLALWLIAVIMSLIARGPIPIDETRYLSVAWEMWLRGDYWVPYLNGQPYSHKPPLLFWIYQAGWQLFGVNEWWPRIVQPLFAALSIVVTSRLAARLWPDNSYISSTVPWVIVGCIGWTFFTPFILFDMALTFFVLSGLWGLLMITDGRNVRGSALLVLGTTLGILTKGPVILLHILFPLISVRWWAHCENKNFTALYGAVALSMVAAVGLALIWAIPAASLGGHQYEQAIFWHQTVDRMGQSAPHQQSWWWYLLILPTVMFPWSFWAPVWKSVCSLKNQLDFGLRFCLAWVFPVFIVLSILPSKQAHYLIPIVPGIALIITRALSISRSRLSKLSLAPVVSVLALAGVVMIVLPRMFLSELPNWSTDIQIFWGVCVIGVAVLTFLISRNQVKKAVFQIATISVIATLLIEYAIFTAGRPAYTISNAAQILKQLEAKNEKIAVKEKYHGQFHFIGRLNKPFDVIGKYSVCFWAKNHGPGYVVQFDRTSPFNQRFKPEYFQRYRNRGWLTIWNASILCHADSENEWLDEAANSKKAASTPD